MYANTYRVLIYLEAIKDWLFVKMKSRTLYKIQNNEKN